MKRTKTKLVSSIVTLLICFAMLIGSTFAWFTDSASTGVNKIQAGNLDLVVEHKNASVSGYKTASYVFLGTAPVTVVLPKR